MPNSPLGGIMVPAVTPFDNATGEMARGPFQDNLKAHLSIGVSGVLVAGSSGEAALLDDAERATLIGWAREVVPADRWLLAGVGSESTRQTIARAKAAQAAGADAVLVVAPHYYLKRTTEAALHAHYLAVADASPIPVLLYNIPVYAHLVLPPTLIGAMSMHGNVIGMKDSAGNLPVLQEYLAHRSDSFRVLTGSGATTAPALRMGVAGAILANALYAGPLVMALLDAHAKGDEALANTLQVRLAPLATDIAAAFGPAGIKAALDLVGLQGGPPRSPLQALNVEEVGIVRARLESAGMIPA